MTSKRMAPMYPAFIFASPDRQYRGRLGGLVLALFVGAAAACGGGSTVSAPEDDAPPTQLSFAAIQGDWEGVIQRPAGGISEWGELSISRDSAPSGQVVGTFDLYPSEDGELLCIADLLARTSTPPTYVFGYTTTFGEGSDECVEGGQFKFEHHEDTDELTYFWKAPGSENFVEWGTFSRID